MTFDLPQGGEVFLRIHPEDGAADFTVRLTGDGDTDSGGIGALALAEAMGARYRVVSVIITPA